MENKIAIITIITRNYGNRLQNYALQQAIQKLGADVKTIPLVDGQPKINKLFLCVKSLYNLIRHNSVSKWEWFDRNIYWEKKAIKNNEAELNAKYDFFIVGSDQVWNPLFDINSDRELLTFTTNNKKISYAASIGLSDFPLKYIEHYASEWKKFAKISVREQDAEQIVYNATGRKVQVVLDPTMLLTKEEWNVLMPKHHKELANSKYCVKYFLGKIEKEYDEFVKEYALKNNLKIIDILDKNGKTKNEIGPAEFICLIARSEVVFTDSFHGTVFSILYHRSFLAFERTKQSGYGKMSSRIDNLLETFSLTQQKINKISDLDKVNLNYDKERVEYILNLKRNESIEFLKSLIE